MLALSLLGNLLIIIQQVVCETQIQAPCFRHFYLIPPDPSPESSPVETQDQVNLPDLFGNSASKIRFHGGIPSARSRPSRRQSVGRTKGATMDRWDARDKRGAEDLLNALCQADLRCLQAHAGLGHIWFKAFPKVALWHYEVGLGIGRLSLGSDFLGVLPWGCDDNRPFLRCMHGFGLCLWRLGRFEEAEGVFLEMLGLNPVDNQGVRFLLDPVRAHRSWDDFAAEEEGE